MTDEELRAMVRDAIAKHLGTSSNEARPAAISRPVPTPPWRAHASFGKFLLPSGSDLDGPCLIEPAVQCNHCGYCLSHGH